MARYRVDAVDGSERWPAYSVRFDGEEICTTDSREHAEMIARTLNFVMEVDQ